MQRKYLLDESKLDRSKSKSTLSHLWEEYYGPSFDFQGLMESCFNLSSNTVIHIDESKEPQTNSDVMKPHLKDSGTSSLNEEDQSFVTEKDGIIPSRTVKNIVHKFSECSANYINSPIEKEKWHLVVRELIDTEKVYLQSLEDVKNGYLRMLNGVLVDDVEMVLIFSNWNQLYEFHSEFLVKIKSINCYDFNELRKLSQCFIDEMQQFEYLYSEYCTNYSQSIKHLDNIEATSSDTWNSLVKCQTELGHQLPLSTFLLKPVQRILKYHLLLKELIQCCKLLQNANATDTVTCLFTALEQMLQVVNRINEKQMKREEYLRRLQLRDELNSDIVSSMPDCPSLGEPFLDGDLKVPGCKNSRLVLLCENALILAKRLTGGKWDIKQIIKCSQMVLFECIPKQPLEFHVVDITDNKNKATLQVMNVEDKETWCKMIKQLIINTFKNNPMSERAKRVLLDNKTNVLAQANPADNQEVLDKFHFKLNRDDDSLDLESSSKYNIIDYLNNISINSTKNKGIKRRNSVGAIKSEAKTNFRDPSMYQWSSRRKFVHDDFDYEDSDCRSIIVDVIEESRDAQNSELTDDCDENYAQQLEKSRNGTQLTPEDIQEIFMPLQQMQDNSRVLLEDAELASIYSDPDLDSVASDKPTNGLHKRKTTSMDRNFGATLCVKANSFNVNTTNKSSEEFTNSSQLKKVLFSSVRETKTTRSNSDWGSLFDAEAKPGLMKRILKASVKFTKRDKGKPNSYQMDNNNNKPDGMSHLSPKIANNCDIKRTINKSNSIDYIVQPVNNFKKSPSPKKKKRTPTVPISYENQDNEEECKSEPQYNDPDPPSKPPRFVPSKQQELVDRTKSVPNDRLKIHTNNHVRSMNTSETLTPSQTSNSESSTPAKVKDLCLLFQSNR